eukprot:TRINITY_DN940_c0_g1_i1.p1 TRINITY_DN940_c0_g1~~TRINITY_DN940_c0_g1_i1.p1  ORF type:complete len:268 (+),score=64.71 TRINITY_DN940_c0_g1_i1:203-1006(+)
MAYQRNIYPKQVDLYPLDSNSIDNKRVQWDADKTRTLLEAIKTVQNGEFMKLLGAPMEEKKRQMPLLKQGWDLVRRVMLRRYPDFSLTRVQLSDKWRKLHLHKSEGTSDFPKKTTEDLMKEFKVGESIQGGHIVSLSAEGNVAAGHLVNDGVMMEYTVETEMDSKVGGGDQGEKRKTTEELLAELENETYRPPPPKKKAKKTDNEGRTPVEAKRIELMMREHKARMIREGELFHYEQKIKMKKLEILDMVKSKVENQQAVNLDVLGI